MEIYIYHTLITQLADVVWAYLAIMVRAPFALCRGRVAIVKIGAAAWFNAGRIVWCQKISGGAFVAQRER